MMLTASPTRARAVTPILHHIRSLESYVERSGARLVRAALPESVQGRVFSDVITLRADLNPEQELLALVHELVHWLAHRDPAAHTHCAHCTIFEYEAEAVEALVMARLGLTRHAYDPVNAGDECPTDGLLSASVARVIWASGRICHALGLS
jgi:hypothetical protein